MTTDTLSGVLIGAITAWILTVFQSVMEFKRRKHIACAVFSAHIGYVLAVFKNIKEQLQRGPGLVAGHLIPYDLMAEYRPMLVRLLDETEFDMLETAYRQCLRNDHIMDDAMAIYDGRGPCDAVYIKHVAVYHGWALGCEPQIWLKTVEAVEAKLRRKSKTWWVLV